MRITLFWQRLRQAQSGVAAIEFALMLPLLLTLSLGMLDFSSAFSTQRKLNYAATVMAQLVTQRSPQVTAAEVDDFFKAAQIAMRSGANTNDVRVEVYAFRLNEGTVEQRWTRSNSVEGGCTPPETIGLPDLMNGPNDVVVAVVCTTYTVQSAWVVERIIDTPTINLQAQMVFRPRAANTIDCPTCT